ncbi:MAG TPA: hypothetical protein PKA27_10180 [Fimbriimonadaceae bacterium]|nr:hypothetical protein [Fimbriimonadaceae bacterium]
MARKRKRRKPNWPPILWSLFVANLIAGLLWSKATSVRTLKVVGARPSDESRLKREAQFLRQIPCFRVDKAKFEEKVGFPSFVEVAELNRNVFGRGTLTIRYRAPVASVSGSPKTYIDKSGQLFVDTTEVLAIPSVRFQMGLSPGVSLASSAPLLQGAQLARELFERPTLVSAEIDVRDNGSLCLNLGTNTVIELGPFERINEKLATYDGLLASNPKLLEEAKVLILMAPDQPAIKKKNQ